MLTAEEIKTIHSTLVEWFAADSDPISPPGVKSLSLIESAAGRPMQTAGGKDVYPRIMDKVAALFHSLVNNHGFHNGNKRVGLVCAQIALAKEGYWLDKATDDELFDFTRKAAAHEICGDRKDEVTTIANWLDAHSKKIRRGERPMKYHDLKERLSHFGFELDPPDGDMIDIKRDGIVIQTIIKQGIKGFKPYHTDYVWGLRKRLELTPENGIDSDRFYGEKSAESQAEMFIELRMEVMRRLAKI
jgi:death-on-curing protein